MLYVPQVHRYFLGRDSSAFEHMFSMPSEGSALSHNVEGCSDENPVQLFGESVERFRALLSVIYDLYVSLSLPLSSDTLADLRPSCADVCRFARYP